MIYNQSIKCNGSNIYTFRTQVSSSPDILSLRRKALFSAFTFSQSDKSRPAVHKHSKILINKEKSPPMNAASFTSSAKIVVPVDVFKFTSAPHRINNSTTLTPPLRQAIRNGGLGLDTFIDAPYESSKRIVSSRFHIHAVSSGYVL